ncbi:hypothetical protein [Thermogutta sp.]|uniref:GspE/PulE/PilB domain-containing protein n=1 Tax=Thermogutta sp. TaxID=1962930 RepID=UPI0032204920
MAKKPIDVYRDWLGIEETQRPLNYYQLLKLPLFEDDVNKIREQYRKLNAYVRKYATGDYAFESQQLLNELAKAMLCLTDTQRKREYDAMLGRKDFGEGVRRTVEEILLANRAITPENLERARRFAQAVGLAIHDAIIQQKLAAPDVVMQAYAESQGLPFVDLQETTIDVSLLDKMPPALARQYSCLPIMVDDNQLLVASPFPLNPDVEETLRHLYGLPVRSVITTPIGINAAVTRYMSGRGDGRGQKAAPAHQKASASQTFAPRSPERFRQDLQYAIVAFNLTVILLMLAQFMLRTVYDWSTVIGMMILAVIGGIIVGGVTIVYLSRRP